MYRKIFVAKNTDDLTVRLPDEYLHKDIEVIAFDLGESVTLFVNWLTAASLIIPENTAVVHSARSLMTRYRLQPFDVKIVASSLEADCTVLYSEDMQNGLMIGNRLRIVNPFI